MRTQVWIIGAAFALFGVVGWAFQGTFSPAYVGLILTGAACFVIGALTEK
jgi:membrane-bound ClpP family serine protease